MVQLGKWSLSCLLDSEEDILVDPNAMKFSPEIDMALSPHSAILSSLLSGKHIGEGLVPAAEFVNGNTSSRYEALRRGGVPWYGDLSIEDRAQIHNWIHTKLTDAR